MSDREEPRATAEVHQLALLLDEADRTRRPLPRAAAFPGTLRDAYAVQRAYVARRSARLGSARQGFKVALTSEATQSGLGATEPAAGELLACDVLATGATVTRERVFAPVVEVELVFRVEHDLPARAGLDEVLASTSVAAALELPDSRYSTWFGGELPALPLSAVVADNCLAGLLVVGSVWRDAASVDLTSVRTTLWPGDRPVVEGSSAEVLDHPGSAVLWLNRHLAAHGSALRAGTLISSGTLTPPLVLTPGVTRAEVDSGLGEVSVYLPSHFSV